MGVKTNWANTACTVLICRLIDPWTWRDYHAASRHVHEMLDSVAHQVITVVDFSNAATLPKDSLVHFKHALRHTHPRQALLIIVGANTFIHTIGAIITKTYPTLGNNLHIVSTIEDAYDVIADYHGDDALSRR
jgi:hypothetical protein